MNYQYLLKEIKRANRKSIKLFTYLKNMGNEEYDYYLQVNLNRLCDINEILTNLEIDLEIKLDETKESKVKSNDK